MQSDNAGRIWANYRRLSTAYSTVGATQHIWPSDVDVGPISTTIYYCYYYTVMTEPLTTHSESL